ncbi:MAG: glycosyltransferase family 1 protein [Planctomycetota bacterium]
MRIALDARVLAAPQRRGIAKSLFRLYQALALARPDWQVVAYHRGLHRLDLTMPDNVVEQHVIEIPGDRFDAWPRLRLPAAVRNADVDLLHCPANAGPRWMPKPTVVTVHDLIPLDMPEGRDETEVDRFEVGVRTACRRAAAVVCPSAYTRERLIAEHGLNPARGFVVPWGVTTSPADPTDPHTLTTLNRYQLEHPYFLHFGAAEPRKNTRGLIEAYALVPPVYRQRVPLLILGLDERAKAEMTRLADSLGVPTTASPTQPVPTRTPRGLIRFAGFVPEDDLGPLLAGALSLAYPSYAEGFGLPILEAFAAGIPVLASDRSAIPEIAHDAAEVVHPDDRVAITKALTRLAKDPLRRRELVHLGRQRVTAFSWKHAAEAFAAALEHAAVQARRPSPRVLALQQRRPAA